MSTTVFKNIKEYFSVNKQFVIPNYQRGYKWSVKKGANQSALEKLCDDLIKAPRDQKYFLQGVTVSEDDENIILIDGQQRTTSLYFLLWYLKVEFFDSIILHYDIRDKSKEFINCLKKLDFDYQNFDSENSSQDIFYFKEAIKQIDNKLNKFDLLEFSDFLLDKVNILYITIDKGKATKTFTMMNGAKATMLQEELIKAEILRQISFPSVSYKKTSTSIDDNLSELKNIISIDWETNAKRSRYAREWDKWLYWWNQKEVQQFFNTERPLGLLLDFYFSKETFNNEKRKYFQFKMLLSKKTSIQIFKELRDLQKSFEDVMNNSKIYNYLKLSLLCSGDPTDTYNVLDFFFSNKSKIQVLNDYSKWRVVGATHRQITKENDLRDNEDSKEQRASDALKSLSQKFVYNNHNDLALKQLLRLNVEEDNKLFNGIGRKFDFTIYDKNKSLEHIHPKSKVFHIKKTIKDGVEVVSYYNGNGIIENSKPLGEDWLDRDLLEDCTEHSIGNLVLLDKNENSKFNNKPFKEKKEIYFNINEGFKSRNLLHTIAVFSKSSWTKEDIEKNQYNFLTRFKKDYGISE